jgi:serine/threonine protein kinase/tetratricopeptide (TPR) repeat protein
MTPESIGRYRILRPLGAGGMGEVYLGEDLALNRRVAIKMLPAASGFDATANARLVQEAQAAATLDHPHVCAVYEVGEHDGAPFIAMQYIEGETLTERLARGPLSITDAVRIAEQVADALTAAHAAGIIHRDIKPGNIMLTARGDAKVLDFGLAKLIGAAHAPDAPTKPVLTGAGVVLGTTAYMSPEQLRAEPLGGSTDVFSLGCVIYEMTSGGAPFPRDSTAATIAAVLGEEPRPLPSSIPSELRRIIRKCLEKDPARRYATGGDLLVDLRTLIRDTTASVPQAEPRRERARTLYIASIAGALALLAGAAWISLRPTPAGESVRVLAVLPFVTDSTSSDYLGEGISESVINSLSQLPQLKVLARTTTFRYRGENVDLAALRTVLGVDAVVTGRVLQQGESLVVSAELTNAADGSQIWGQRYSNHRLTDVFAVQEAIAREIAAGLKLGLGGREAGFSKRYTEDVEAYRLYVVGRERAQRRTVADLQAAADLYRQAIARDQRYALAWAGLTDTYILLGSRGALPAAESRTLASEAAARAYAIDPDLAEANAASGQLDAYAAPFDFEAADRKLRRAIELNPGLAISHQFLAVSLLEQGRLDEGVAVLEVARELDPLSGFITRFLAFAHLLRGEGTLAMTLYRGAAPLGPAFATNWDAELYQNAAAVDEGLAELQRVSGGREADPFVMNNKGMLLAARGDRDQAQRLAAELERGMALNPALGSFAARIRMAMGDYDRALEILTSVVDANAMTLFYKDQPVWKPIRRDERFQALLRRMRVPTD